MRPVASRSFASDRAREKTVAAQPVVLNALGKVAYDLNFSNRRPSNAEGLWANFLDRILDIDFSHANPMWRYYELSDRARPKRSGHACRLPA